MLVIFGIQHSLVKHNMQFEHIMQWLTISTDCLLSPEPHVQTANVLHLLLLVQPRNNCEDRFVWWILFCVLEHRIRQC